MGGGGEELGSALECRDHPPNPPRTPGLGEGLTFSARTRVTERKAARWYPRDGSAIWRVRFRTG